MDKPKDQDKPAAPKKKREKRVIAKHLAVARNVARGATLQEAGEAVGYPAKSARQAAFKAMQTIKRKAPEVFDEKGLTLDSLADDVNRLRKMKRIQYFAKDGIVLDQREHEAADIQIKAVDMGLQVQGAYAAQKMKISGDLTLDLNHVADDDLDRIITELSKPPEPPAKA